MKLLNRFFIRNWSLLSPCLCTRSWCKNTLASVYPILGKHNLCTVTTIWLVNALVTTGKYVISIYSLLGEGREGENDGFFFWMGLAGLGITTSFQLAGCSWTRSERVNNPWNILMVKRTWDRTTRLSENSLRSPLLHHVEKRNHSEILVRPKPCTFFFLNWNVKLFPK